MSDNKLYEFLNRLAKQRKIKIGALAEQCNMSRTTLYRYAKGIIQIPPSVESIISNALNMSKVERSEFRRLISLTVKDGSLISSRYVLDRLVFQNDASETKAVDIQYAFHCDDSFLRNSQEITDMFLQHYLEEAFSCDIKIVGCVDEGCRDNLQSMLKKLLGKSDAVTAEHLLMFPKKDYLRCTETLLAILPLLGFYHYNVLYDEASADSKGSFLNNMILAEISYYNGNCTVRKYYVLSYLTGALSQCAAFDNEYLFRFFTENYQHRKSSCQKSLTGAKNIPALNEFLMGLELTTQQCLLKPTPCYNKIPPEVYKRIENRLSSEAREQLSVESQEDIANLLSALNTRYQIAHKNGSIDTYSKQGLLDFAKNGLLTDHVHGLPPFDIEERKMILLSFKERLHSKKDGYHLYITEKNIQYILSAYKDNGLVIEFPHSYSKGSCSNVFILNKMLADILFDYVIHHIPAYHALPKQEAIVFLDELIKMLD